MKMEVCVAHRNTSTFSCPLAPRRGSCDTTLLGGPLFLIHPEKSVSDSFGACEFAASREFTRDFVGRGTPLVGNDDGAVTGGHLRAFRIAHHEPDQVATGLDVKAGFHRKSGMAEALIGRVA